MAFAQKPPLHAGDEDIYAAFEPTSGQDNQWGQSSNPYNVPGVAPVPSGGGNPLMQRPPSKWGAAPTGSSWGGAGAGPVGTSYLKNGPGYDARPMTSNRASGFTAQPGGPQGASWDPTGAARMAQLGPAPPLQKRGENSPEEQCMEMDRQVNALIEESAMLAMQGDHGGALEKAKEAGKKERALCKQREQLGLGDQINIDLTYAVHFNLAVQYHRHQLFTEALNTYSLIVRNMQYPQSGRLRVNMGNIYAEQKKYLLAIKMYRMTLEEIPSAGKELRFKIMRNIGNAFVRMGQYKDAVGSYESVLEGNADVITGFNLLLCYYALGEIDKLKRTFSKLLSIKSFGMEDGEEESEEKEKDVLVDDALRTEIKERRRKFLHYVTTAARLIAPVLDRDWRVGYDYVIEQLRHYEMKDPASRLASELEMCKTLNYLKFKRYKDAIEGLKAFEKKDKVLRARAATNLAYLYFLEGDNDSGEKYADMSIEADRYNAKALVNKGNFLYTKGEYDRAKQYYTDALTVEADNIEAIYNMGLTTKQLGLYDESLRVFKRLQSLVDSVEVMYQIADLYDIIGDPCCNEWFNRLIGRVPTDPNVLARLGLLFAKEQDESQAFHHYLEAYRYYQVNMDVISWLGAYFVKNEVYDKAMQFFERASQIQPQEVKWQLMVASCHRRRGEYPQAKRLYEDINKKYPENMECLRYLVHLCKDSGLIEEANEWFKRVKKLEQKLAEQQQQQQGNPYGGTNTPNGQNYASGSSQSLLAQDTTRDRSPSETSSRSGPPPPSVAEKTRVRQNNPKDDDDEMILPGT
jgi:intraflagellar transport protein 88